MTHLAVAKRILYYLKDSADLAIVFKKGHLGLEGYTDASFAANPENRKSITGYMFKFCGVPVSSGAVTQTPTAQSTLKTVYLLRIKGGSVPV